MLRVLQVTSTPVGIGGVERMVLSAANQFDEQRFAVSYTNLFGRDANEGEFPRQLRALGVSYHHVPGASLVDVPSVVVRLARVLRSERIDIVQPHMPHANIVTAAAARLAGTRVVLSTRHYCQDDSMGSRGRRLRALDLRCAKHATHILAVSDAVRRSLLAHAVPDEKITVIANGVDSSIAEKGPPPVPWSEEWAAGRILIGCVAGLRAYKGVDILLRAAALMREGRRIGVVIVGEGPERPALTRLAESLGLSGDVVFTGFHPKPAAILGAFDVYAQPSRAESFGIAMLEAMAAQRPVVASSVGGIPEIVQHGVTGLVVPSDDVYGFAAALARLVDDEQLRRSMGTAGRGVVESRYALPLIVRQYEALYASLCPGAAG